MKFTQAPLSGLIIIEPQVFDDDRGYFFESYHQQKFEKGGIKDSFVQDNQSFSTKNTVRGLHFQKPPYAQSKLVRVISGEVYDVVVDLRKDSPTLGKWFGITLSEENKTMMYIPVGFAHGFCVTSETAMFLYKCGDLYHKESESGILWNDPEININWPIKKEDALVSQKDSILPSFSEVKEGFVW